MTTRQCAPCSRRGLITKGGRERPGSGLPGICCMPMVISPQPGTPNDQFRGRRAVAPGDSWCRSRRRIREIRDDENDHARANAVIRRQQPMDDAQADRAAFDTAERLLGAPLVLPLGPGEPRTLAPPERSTATRSRWRSSRKLRALSRRPGPKPTLGRFCAGRRPVCGCGSAQPPDSPGVQGQAGACQQVVSIPARAGTAPQNKPSGAAAAAVPFCAQASRSAVPGSSTPAAR